jgi:hypothetical protein
MINWISLLFRTGLGNKIAAEIVACIYVRILITECLKLRAWRYLPRKIVARHIEVA